MQFYNLSKLFFPIIKNDFSIYENYNIQKSKRQFINKNTNKIISSSEYMVLLNTYLNENLAKISFK